jgi:transposase
MNIAVEQFAAYANPKQDKIIVLLVDRAGWHTTGEVALPPGLRLFPLPPYTPELQPTECAWPPIREPLANRPIETLDELERLVIKRCRYFMDHPDKLQRRVGHEWIIEAERKVSRD